MKSLALNKKQIWILLLFSIMSAIFAIINGIFFDLNFKEIQRLTLEGIVVTLIIIFPAILLLEWVFDLNNRKELDSIKKRLKKLEKSR